MSSNPEQGCRAPRSPPPRPPPPGQAVCSRPPAGPSAAHPRGWSSQRRGTKSKEQERGEEIGGGSKVGRCARAARGHSGRSEAPAAGALASPPLPLWPLTERKGRLDTPAGRGSTSPLISSQRTFAQVAPSGAFLGSRLLPPPHTSSPGAVPPPPMVTRAGAAEGGGQAANRVRAADALRASQQPRRLQRASQPAAPLPRSGDGSEVTRRKWPSWDVN